MKMLLIAIAVLFCQFVSAQTTYEDSIKNFQANYVKSHEVVKGNDKNKLHFFDVNSSLQVLANFTPSVSAEWLSFKTSGTRNKVYRLYGTLSFEVDKKKCSLNVYQSQELMSSQEYKNYLFLPFTDLTTGVDTYNSGRYLDLTTLDIKADKLMLDFNKAYNPYCAYVSGIYNCPIPPKENALPIAIKAGEKMFDGH